MASELYFSHIELWTENNDPQHRHNPLQFPKKFSENLYYTKDTPRNILRLMADFAHTQFVASKVILEF